MISSDEAFLILRKWADEKHPLKLLMTGEGFRMSFAGVIEEITDFGVAFFPAEPNFCDGESVIALAGCKFQYGDSREALPSSTSRLKFSSILTILRPDGTTFMFAELRL